MQGTSNTYALRKLRKDRPDLHERVLAEEIPRFRSRCISVRCVYGTRMAPPGLRGGPEGSSMPAWERTAQANHRRTNA